MDVKVIPDSAPEVATSRYENGNIIITIPMSLVAFAAENNPDQQMKITDLDKAGISMADGILKFDGEVNAEEDQVTFYRLLDAMLFEAAEGGAEWIEMEAYTCEGVDEEEEE